MFLHTKHCTTLMEEFPQAIAKWIHACDHQGKDQWWLHACLPKWVWVNCVRKWQEAALLSFTLRNTSNSGSVIGSTHTHTCQQCSWHSTPPPPPPPPPLPPSLNIILSDEGNAMSKNGPIRCPRRLGCTIHSVEVTEQKVWLPQMLHECTSICFGVKINV